MTDHSAKTAALMAYESGALSEQGRARLERHLRGCAVCQRELATIQAYEVTVDAIRDDRGPALDWSKMELALEREAQAQAKKHRRGWALPALGVALAAAAALWLALPTGSTETPTTVATAPTYVIDRQPPDVVAPPSTVAEAPSAYASAVVTLVAGSSSIGSGADTASAHVGARLSADDVISTDAGSTLHARLGAGLVVAMQPSTQLRLDDGADGPAIAIEHGRLATHVRQARTVFLAGAYRIEAEVASFVIDFDAPDALALEVLSGEVHVTGPGLDTHLTGPALFPAEAQPLEASQPIGDADGYDALPELHASRDGIVRWEIGDVAVEGAGTMAMRIGEGPITINGWDAQGHLFRTTATVGPDGLDLTPDQLTPQAPRVRQGVLAEEDIVPVVRQHYLDLRRCYEHQLRTTPTLPEVHIVARISVEMTGSVADDGVRFSGDEMPPAMAECMSHNIETWIFPAPTGGPVTIPAPFVFEPR